MRFTPAGLFFLLQTNAILSAWESRKRGFSSSKEFEPMIPLHWGPCFSPYSPFPLHFFFLRRAISIFSSLSRVLAMLLQQNVEGHSVRVMSPMPVVDFLLFLFFYTRSTNIRRDGVRSGLLRNGKHPLFVDFSATPAFCSNVEQRLLSFHDQSRRSDFSRNTTTRAAS